jgi:hypothetical protein
VDLVVAAVEIPATHNTNSDPNQTQITQDFEYKKNHPKLAPTMMTIAKRRHQSSNEQCLRFGENLMENTLLFYRDRPSASISLPC